MLIKQFNKVYAGKSGVYVIKNCQGKILYVGSSKEIGDAYSRHKSNLRNGSYYETNKHKLQLLFNEEDLIFTVLKECKENELLREETKYIKLYRDTIVNKDSKGKRRSSKSTKAEKMKRRKANSGENNPHNTKLSENDVKEIKMLLLKGCSIKELAEQYQVSKTLIYNIKKGTRWSSVEVEEENKKEECTAIHKDFLITIDPRENEEALHPKMTEERKRNLEAFKRRTAMLKDYFVEEEED